jgi:DNA-binding NtrC family response regulator
MARYRSTEKIRMMHVLVIDDDANVGAAIEAILASQNIKTTLAFRAHSGIHALELSIFDVAIVDIFMPGMSGLDTIEKIKQRAPNVPTVAMTGFRFRASMDPAMDFLGLAVQRGATSRLRKPFTPQQLIDAINESRLRSNAMDETFAVNGLLQC